MPSSSSRVPTFRQLTTAECRKLLARHHVGRLAFTFREHVDIEPIHYVFADGEIVFRTAAGSKFDILRHHPWVAFEVDEVDGLFDWRSVVVHGTIYRLQNSGSRADVAAYKRAIRQLRGLVEGTFKADDPTPFRDVVIRLYVDEVTGRAARSRPAASRKKPKPERSR